MFTVLLLYIYELKLCFLCWLGVIAVFVPERKFIEIVPRGSFSDLSLGRINLSMTHDCETSKFT